MSLADPAHPVWEILRGAVLLAALALVLWLNASNFDATELRAIGEFLLIYLGYSYGEKRIRRHRERARW